MTGTQDSVFNVTAVVTCSSNLILFGIVGSVYNNAARLYT
jgi:hypothetical protein